ncbi:DUF480 domain-containing protein [Sphingobacterium sp. T2]|uniref:DUF480 domain-containing protein n=1 Tax=Sphingobacterium sp. T2 TaxID=1590596 RepID=UPI0029343F84|nr:DUF480 domain-containing protein [Sphingobacterium sp. T2]
MEENITLPQLNQEQIRVLGCLLEKSKTTPEYYPLTVNALVAACNQKTSRKPVVNYNEETVIHTLDSLQKNRTGLYRDGWLLPCDQIQTQFGHTISIDTG